MNERTIMICADGGNTLFYDTAVSLETLKAAYEKAEKKSVVDIFEIKQEEIQYYLIDGRFHMNERKDAVMLKLAGRVRVDYQEYESKEAAMKFFEGAIWACEGSERERMSFAYFNVKAGHTNINTYLETAI